MVYFEGVFKPFKQLMGKLTNILKYKFAKSIIVIDNNEVKSSVTTHTCIVTAALLVYFKVQIQKPTYPIQGHC